MRITAKEWMALTSGEQMAALKYAAELNQKRWERG